MNARLIAYAMAAGALLVLGWQWRERGGRIDALLAANATLAAEHAQCTAERDALDQAVADIRRAGEAHRAARAAAEARAARISTDAERRVRAALTADVPAECEAAVHWLGEQGRALAREWEASR